ncbi:TetR/AcrR family transcriptional regulator [Flavobacterium gawalongense]|uniref:TetR/AcrR family transcriptional regulator n=2 Tax=Flavobacterium gawalongense TaxID=2594432 RepID=A0A553BZ54_9FLAO|nr:TetR/AcrR family transcriptional regulator [Flavobacterium gawalongense]TRX10393.1 TetR/AcrR family transcriptional regulator [Flavobacterium gawalongense]TRX13443.1 TetR/AcrR family transcriptional regulator [Flavobacterium gawalongense]TRX15626.1 TetR/AcrR family transcriptional regulator [Flavobacterium gawalongense]TRX31464.1 TetR/AcrR family transcriptional regulator [Flavobacterium gawalongense]
MELQLQIKMNEALFLRNPEQTELGKKILMHSIQLIYKNGFETFTFKKLAKDIGTTEAGIYRYFENKHRLLLYLVAWYWSWLEYQISFHTNNINDPLIRLKMVIKLLATTVKDDEKTSYVNESLLHQIVISEGSKAYLTKHVSEDNRHHFFKPYKDLCAVIGDLISECNPKYKYPKSLASTIIEMAHFQNFFMNNLPSLTDFGINKDEAKIISFLDDLVFSSINKI